jgi:hypothetical protein
VKVTELRRLLAERISGGDASAWLPAAELALLAIAAAVERRVTACCQSQSVTTDDYTQLEYNECAGGTHCSMCPVAKADALIVAAFAQLEAVDSDPRPGVHGAFR